MGEPLSRRRAADLIEIDVRAVAGIRTSSPRRQWVEDGDGVAHRAAGDEEAGLFAQHLRRQLFQPVDGRVLAIDIVADLGAIHRLAHGGRRLGDGVAAQVDAACGRGERADA